MLREDVLVEVRDVNLTRVGTITTKYLQLNAVVRHNDVGEWTVTLPGDHPMVPHLVEDGSGLIVSLRGETLFSGQTIAPKRKRDRENTDGTFTFSGVTDEQILADARAFPDPSSGNPGVQSKANDTRTAGAESLMRQYVAFNIANGDLVTPPTGWAPAERLAGLRRRLRLEEVNQGRGIIVSKSPRFQVLLELLQEIGSLANLGFRVVQRGGHLVFEVITLRDRSDTVRLDIENGTLTSEEVAKSAPTITRAIVAGQGEGTERQIILRTTPTSVAAEDSTGRVIETFIDQRDTDDTTELEQSGDEQLIAGGAVQYAVKVVPSDDQTMLYGVDWVQGDTVAVIVNEQETKTRVAAAAIVLDSNAVAVGAAIGDVTGFRREDALAQRVAKTEKRVESIERSVEVGGSSWDAIDGKPTTFAPAPHTHPSADIEVQSLSVVDLNVITAQGTYHQHANANALAGANYPVPLAGLLEVWAASAMRYQRYTAYNGSGQYAREWYNGIWFAWRAISVDAPGDVKITASANIPQGWLLCNGAAISRTTYAALFAAIGTRYGAGDGSTTFNLPPTDGRTVVGVDSSQTEFSTLGKTGGAKTVLLTANQSGLRSHTHVQRHASTSGSSFGLQAAGALAGAVNGYQTTAANSALNAAEAHENLPPYIAMNYIIKT